MFFCNFAHAIIKKMDMYSVSGWLAKEGKLKAKYVKPKEIQVKYKPAEGF